MKIALLSDTHNNWTGLRMALDDIKGFDCEAALFAGDLTRPKGITFLEELNLPVHMVTGNMDQNIDEIWAQAEATDNVIFHGEVCDIDRKGTRIFMHHYPEKVEKKADNSEYNLCIHGHRHKFRDDTHDGTRLINPGALTTRSSDPEWAAYDTQDGSLRRFSYSN